MNKNLVKPREYYSEFDLQPIEQEFKISPLTVTKFLGLFTILLSLAHIITLYIVYNSPRGARIPLLLDKYFNLGNEANFPTFFSSVILLIASGLLFYIYKIVSAVHYKNKTYWLILSFIFLFLCFDEAAMIHDELVLTVRSRLPNTTGIFFYSWVIPYAILVLAGGILFLRFVLSLPNRTRNLFFVSGFVYVFGAMGFEFFEGYVETMYGKENFMYLALITLEEILEMVGIVIFIQALLEYLSFFETKLIIADNIKV